MSAGVYPAEVRSISQHTASRTFPLQAGVVAAVHVVPFLSFLFFSFLFFSFFFFLLNLLSSSTTIEGRS